MLSSYPCGQISLDIVARWVFQCFSSARCVSWLYNWYPYDTHKIVVIPLLRENYDRVRSLQKLAFFPSQVENVSLGRVERDKRAHLMVVTLMSPRWTPSLFLSSSLKRLLSPSRVSSLENYLRFLLSNALVEVFKELI